MSLFHKANEESPLAVKSVTLLPIPQHCLHEHDVSDLPFAVRNLAERSSGLESLMALSVTPRGEHEHHPIAFIGKPNAIPDEVEPAYVLHAVFRKVTGGARTINLTQIAIALEELGYGAINATEAEERKKELVIYMSEKESVEFEEFADILIAMRTKRIVRRNSLALREKLYGRKEKPEPLTTFEPFAAKDNRRCCLQPLRPDSAFRAVWESMMFVIMMYILISAPVQIAFYREHIPVRWVHLGMFLDCIFICDLALNFMTAYLLHDRLVTSYSRIARRYLTSWFVFDLLSAVPVDIFIFFR